MVSHVGAVLLDFDNLIFELDEDDLQVSMPLEPMAHDPELSILHLGPTIPTSITRTRLNPKSRLFVPGLYGRIANADDSASTSCGTSAEVASLASDTQFCLSPDVASMASDTPAMPSQCGNWSVESTVKAQMPVLRIMEDGTREEELLSPGQSPRCWPVSAHWSAESKVKAQMPVLRIQEDDMSEEELLSPGQSPRCRIREPQRDIGGSGDDRRIKRRTEVTWRPSMPPMLLPVPVKVKKSGPEAITQKVRSLNALALEPSREPACIIFDFKS